MKSLELKVARLRKGLTQKDMADKLGCTVSSYCNKENGKSSMNDDEKMMVTEIFGWSLQQMNDFLYDGVLPIGKSDAPNREYRAE